MKMKNKITIVKPKLTFFWNEIQKLRRPTFEFVTMDPFTNQPYAFDDSGVSADPREVEFNNGIREITVRYFTLCQDYSNSNSI